MVEGRHAPHGIVRRQRHFGCGTLGFAGCGRDPDRRRRADDRTYAWFGEQYQRGADLAAADLNAAGGVLGQSVELIVGDDFCDPEQAVAVAHKLTSDGVVLVAGHWCSHASIPASKVYEEAKIIQIAPGSISSKLTDEGGPNVFRVCGRDDRQGAKIADHLADNFANQDIPSLLHDGTLYGRDITAVVRHGLCARGVTVALDEAYTPGEADYSALVGNMQAAGIDVFFVGGYHREAALMLRSAADRSYDVRLIGTSGLATQDFPMIAGPGAEGTLMAGMADARDTPRRPTWWRDSVPRATIRSATRFMLTPRCRSGRRPSRRPGRWNSMR
jgi:branched-chain amino acid transport system substrate-binding protein